MYSLVLAAMLTTGTTTPAWGCNGGGLFHHGCHGCHGCHGAWGCYGGCYSCYGCLGCYGGYGWGCTGCYSCYGSCWGGGGGWGGYACYGGCYGCYGSCSGGWGCYGGGYGGYGGYIESAPPSAPAMPGAPGSKEPIKAPAPAKGTGMVPGRAHILVQLPTDAKLFVDDHAVTLPPNQKTVVTPELEPGQDYYYIFRAEAVRNGTPVAENRRVVIRAGVRVTVDFGDLATAQAKEVPNRVTAQK